MKIKKLLFATVTIILVMSILSGCSIFEIKKTSNDANEVFEEEIIRDEETEYIKDDNDLFNLFEEETTEREYVDIKAINSIEEFKILISSLIDISLYNITEEDNSIMYVMKDEYLSKNSFHSNDIISLNGGTEFTFPIKVKNFKENDWTITFDYSSEGKIYMEDSQGNEVAFYLSSPAEEGMNIDECDISGCRLYTFDENNVKFKVYGSITEKSDFAEIIECIGAPYIIKFGIVTDKYGIVDSEHGTIKSVDLLYTDHENNNNSTQFVISCGKKKSYGGDVENYNGVLFNFTNG
ncbi:MAG: hypothetical protein IJD49_02545 [Clostridia bacterium]|nr:hypothetical protein [Clostridia bacterium]